MQQLWELVEEGFLFSDIAQNIKSVWTPLKMLCLEDMAKEEGNTILIPFANAVLLSDREIELFALPSKNPFQISLKVTGTLTNTNLRYILEVLQPNGTPFVNPKFVGSLLFITNEMRYLLSSEQYQLVSLARNNNETIGKLDRQTVAKFNLSNLAKIQKHAQKLDAKLDGYLSPTQTEIHVIDKLSVDFTNNEDGSVSVLPVPLEKNTEGNLVVADKEEFQTNFSRMYSPQSVLTGGPKKARYVCSDDVLEGLIEIKKVGKISAEEGKRYKNQPRELFTKDVFHFDDISNTQDNIADQNDDWIPSEGDLEDTAYSERVTGITELQRCNYYGNGSHKSNWMEIEGEVEDLINSSSEDDGTNTTVSEESTDNQLNSESDETQNDDLNISDAFGDAKGLIKDDDSSDKTEEVIAKGKERKKYFSLDIKSNINILDYEEENKQRDELSVSMDGLVAEVLRPNIELYPHQTDGVSWLFKEWGDGYKGVLLADDMGLGKTLQTLVFIAALKRACPDYPGITKPLLIVAPTALLKNWKEEYAKYIKDELFSNVFALHGSGLNLFATGRTTPNGKRQLDLKIPDNSICLTTYETLRDYQFSFAEVSWGIIMVDEAQKIKNPGSGITVALKAMKYDFTICLSGTPVENSWVDLWSIMDMVQPAKLGTLNDFKAAYIKRVVESDGDINVISQVGSELKEKLNPLFLRRMKDGYLKGLPQKNVIICKTEMPEYQKRCYATVLSVAKKDNLHPLKVIALLRDISLHPDLDTKHNSYFYETDPDYIISQSARLIKTFELLGDIRSRNEKVLIFVVSRKMQAILSCLIEKKFAISVPLPVNGTINGDARQRIIQDFSKRDGFGVLILSPEAAGVGFTITSANNVIHLSRMWNPAKEDQATDRVYRIGQKKDVNIYIPLAYHKDFGEGCTFDEKLNELLAYKRNLSKKVLFPTSDSKSDGIRMCSTILGKDTDSMPKCYWSIQEIDAVEGDMFEQIISDLYNLMPGYRAEKTPASGDNGADVVVLSEKDQTGLLIQCKHRNNKDEFTGLKGVQEICAAIPYYQNRLYKTYKFTPVVITNAEDYTPSAKEFASNTGVKLIARRELEQYMTEYAVLKCY